MNILSQGRDVKRQNVGNHKNVAAGQPRGVDPDVVDAAAAIGLERLRRSDDPLMHGILWVLASLASRLDAIEVHCGGGRCD